MFLCSAHTGPDISEHIVEQAHNFMSHGEAHFKQISIDVFKQIIVFSNGIMMTQSCDRWLVMLQTLVTLVILQTVNIHLKNFTKKKKKLYAEYKNIYFDESRWTGAYK